MGQIHLHVSISLDGFTTGAQVRFDNPLGDGGEQLHEWLFADPMDPVDADVAAAMYDPAAVGAVLMGRRQFDLGIRHWGDDGTFRMPCFVVTHRPAERVVKRPTTFDFVTDGLDRALAQAQEAAGGKSVKVMGADVTRQLLLAGAIDQIELDIVPILLGDGASLFGGLDPASIELCQIDVRPSSRVTHVRYAVRYAR